ncbi:hypothetical protein BZG36_00884 [Bifiguratus adelaidae]|uniref:Retinol dehydrogenase 12 n=1 Tax=Bifiguratus adelaidae TaxID=1938954 RepID=A0A261Y5G5_9FUNG|nr:hypothetical protein BZG36_00884 [Bifiguratus adelaidae]
MALSQRLQTHLDQINSLLSQELGSSKYAVSYKTGGLGVAGLTLLKRYFNGGVNRFSGVDMTGKTVVITGANTGIGLQTAIELAKRNATVIIASRDSPKTRDAVKTVKEQSGNNRVEAEYIDLADLSSVRAFVDRYKASGRELHILINNAGVMALPKRQTTKDGFEMQFGVNHLAHFLLTNLLLDTIVASAPARIINLSSLASESGSMKWDDLQYEKAYSPFNAYNQSKLANVLFTKELQRRFDVEGVQVTANSCHPGLVRTELPRHVVGGNVFAQMIMTAITPIYWFLTKSSLQGAQTTLYLAQAPEPGRRGGDYYADCGVKTHARNQKVFNDKDEAKRLWEESVKLVKL